MSLSYRIMYRLGLTPWEHTEPPPTLVDLIAGPHALPPGDLLDIGCGTGHDAVYCARHGWNVTGVDVVPRALRQARRNADAAGARIRLVETDIGRATDDQLDAAYTLFLDGGCLHGLPPADLRSAATRITTLAKTGATMLMFAFAPGRRGPLPRGLDAAEISAVFPEWDIAFSRPVDDVVLRGPARNASPYWHQLVKR